MTELEKKSRLPDLLQESFGLSPDIPSFRIHGRDYPNPYIFAKGSYPDPIDIILTPAMGHTHGDFHGLNLLIGDMYGTKKDFYIIDLDSFKSEHPLLFDHAYFEFSFLLNQKKGVGLERWLELVESIIKIENNRDVLNNVEDQRDHGVLWTISLFRLEIWGWISSSHKHRKEDLTNQLFLARVAAGLNYANKKSLDDEDPKHSNKLKEFSFLYAAANLKRFFAFNGVKSPIDGPLAQLDSGSSVSLYYELEGSMELLRRIRCTAQYLYLNCRTRTQKPLRGEQKNLRANTLVYGFGFRQFK